MAEIDSLGSSSYFAGVQNTTNEALKRNRKAEETNKTKKTKFSDILHSSKEEPTTTVDGLPSIISTMTIEDAAIYLKDAVDNAGNDLAEETTTENIANFKLAVQQFLKFMVKNNYEVKSHRPRRVQLVSSTTFFSNYSVPLHRKDPRYQINIINEKLAALTAATMEGQKNNIALLAQIDEIKGLLIDLMN